MITKDEYNRSDHFDPDETTKEQLDEDVFVNDLIDQGREGELLTLAANGKILSFGDKRLTYSNFCLKAFRVTSVHIFNTNLSLVDLTNSYGDWLNEDHPIRSLTELSFNMVNLGDIDKLYQILGYTKNLQYIKIYSNGGVPGNPQYDLDSIYENVTKYNKNIRLDILVAERVLQMAESFYTKEANLKESEPAEFVVVKYLDKSFVTVNHFYCLL